MNKPIVKYTSFQYIPVIGQSAFVFALDHPRLGRQWIVTSTVQKVTAGGFETLNTVYEMVVNAE